MHVPLLSHALLAGPTINEPQYTQIAHTQPVIIPTQSIQPVQQKSPSGMSSSTPQQVGEFTVVVNCKDFNPVSAIILKNESIVQTISILGAGITGIHMCVPAEVKDINFDSYPDFMVPSDNGSGGATYDYWLFSSTTQQFSCPEGNYRCGLMNPEFDSTAKTVISVEPTGAGHVTTDTYRILNGRLVLLKEVKENDYE
ncbi:MAG: hypothetical protein JWM39_434 [Parcubacteria group bacterium]|nr:hypothetical protein [Parcubacteria group bacterium]